MKSFKKFNVHLFCFVLASFLRDSRGDVPSSFVLCFCFKVFFSSSSSPSCLLATLKWKRMKTEQITKHINSFKILELF